MDIQTVKIDNAGTDYGYNYLCFSIVNNKKVIYTGQSCRDYGVDYYYNRFSDGNCANIQLDKIRTIFKLPAQYSKNSEIENSTVENILDFVNQISADLNMEKSNIFAVEEKKSTYMIIGPAAFLLGTPMISLFWSILRVATSHTKNNDYNDTFNKIIEKTLAVDKDCDSYLSKAVYAMIKLFKKHDYKSFFRENILDNFTNNKHSGSSHSGGIVGLYCSLFKPIPEYPYSIVTDIYPIRKELLEEIERKEGEKMFSYYMPEFYKIKVKPPEEKEVIKDIVF